MCGGYRNVICVLPPIVALVGHLFITTQNICKYWDKTFALTTWVWEDDGHVYFWRGKTKWPGWESDMWGKVN